jgi:hypothetical protein
MFTASPEEAIERVHIAAEVWVGVYTHLETSNDQSGASRLRDSLVAQLQKIEVLMSERMLKEDDSEHLLTMWGVRMEACGTRIKILEKSLAQSRASFDWDNVTPHLAFLRAAIDAAKLTLGNNGVAI